MTAATDARALTRALNVTAANAGNVFDAMIGGITIAKGARYGRIRRSRDYRFCRSNAVRYDVQNDMND
jgi:hypothetical protein